MREGTTTKLTNRKTVAAGCVLDRSCGREKEHQWIRRISEDADDRRRVSSSTVVVNVFNNGAPHGRPHRADRHHVLSAESNATNLGNLLRGVRVYRIIFFFPEVSTAFCFYIAHIPRLNGELFVDCYGDRAGFELRLRKARSERNK